MAKAKQSALSGGDGDNSDSLFRAVIKKMLATPPKPKKKKAAKRSQRRKRRNATIN